LSECCRQEVITQQPEEKERLAVQQQVAALHDSCMSCCEYRRPTNELTRTTIAVASAKEAQSLCLSQTHEAQAALETHKQELAAQQEKRSNQQHQVDAQVSVISIINASMLMTACHCYTD
jgi:hypothetical protein